jgi:hypothetical protein
MSALRAGSWHAPKIIEHDSAVANSFLHCLDANLETLPIILFTLLEFL